MTAPSRISLRRTRAAGSHLPWQRQRSRLKLHLLQKLHLHPLISKPQRPKTERSLELRQHQRRPPHQVLLQMRFHPLLPMQSFSSSKLQLSMYPCQQPLNPQLQLGHWSMYRQKQRPRLPNASYDNLSSDCEQQKGRVRRRPVSVKVRE